jgi:hypothetical protein
MVVVVSTRVTTVGAFLSSLASILAYFIRSNPEIIAICALVASFITLAGLSLPTVYNIIRRAWNGPGRHTGWYFEADKDYAVGGNWKYAGWHDRSCAAEKPSCGSRGTIAKGTEHN